jgi:DNA-binding CsgD family transcriptional regulator
MSLSPNGHHRTVLIGRSEECSRLDRLLGEARAGASAILVLRGAAGAGKTALLDYTAGRADGYRVVRAAGVESEMELPFAGLHQLCAPLLDSMGTEAFAERARRELHATGETVRARTQEASAQLTAQESQIAQLARDGLSNPEIAARFFISPRTVQYHLRKVFTKLEISSRTQLQTALDSDLTAA